MSKPISLLLHFFLLVTIGTAFLFNISSLWHAALQEGNIKAALHQSPENFWVLYPLFRSSFACFFLWFIDAIKLRTILKKNIPHSSFSSNLPLKILQIYEKIITIKSTRPYYFPILNFIKSQLQHPFASHSMKIFPFHHFNIYSSQRFYYYAFPFFFTIPRTALQLAHIHKFARIIRRDKLR